VYTLVASRWLLVGDQTRRHSDLLFVARVKPGSPAAGSTVRGAGLKRLDRLFLVAVERQVRANLKPCQHTAPAAIASG
jgi:hypothetical protein